MICKDQKVINRILTLPEVQPTFKHIRYLDDPRVKHILIDGCLFVGAVKDRVMQVHVATPKEVRGKIAISAGEKFVKWVFENLEVTRIYTMICKKRPEVNIYAKMIGGKCYYSDSNYNYYEAVWQPQDPEDHNKPELHNRAELQTRPDQPVI